MNSDPRHNLIETLEKFDTLMVVNAGLDGMPHGRPMAVAELNTFSGELWFATSRTSDIAREVLTFSDAHTVATGQGSGAFVSVTGKMRLVDDRARVNALWRETWRVWFPNGKDDPDLVLMCLTLEAGSYWSVEGASGLRYLFEAAKAVITGEKPAGGDTEQHANLHM